MNHIKDIRLFEKQEPDMDGTSHPGDLRALYGFDGSDLQDIIQRLLFLLRHEGFCLGSFDHLYMNYIPSLPHGQVRLNQRSRDIYHTWYRYTDAGCNIDLFRSMTADGQRRFLAQAIQEAVHLHADAKNSSIFDSCYDQVLELGPDLEIPYKEKAGEHLRVTVSTTIDDDAQFHPIVRIYSKTDKLLLEERLKRCGREAFLAQFGTITLGKKTVRIEPRKSQWFQGHNVKPLKFSL